MRRHKKYAKRSDYSHKKLWFNVILMPTTALFNDDNNNNLHYQSLVHHPQRHTEMTLILTEGFSFSSPLLCKFLSYKILFIKSIHNNMARVQDVEKMIFS